MTEFGRVLTAMVTPFTPAGEVDYRRAQELAEALLASGSDGLVVTGTTGESPTLTNEEKLRLYREVRALRIYEGASDVQKVVIARQTLAAGGN